MPLMIAGIVVLTTGGVVIVTPLQPVAHIIIFVGAVPLLLAVFCLVVSGFKKLVRDKLSGELAQATVWEKLQALVADPLKFGALWQLTYMNLTVIGVGAFMAIMLEDIRRTWPPGDERVLVTGHWHILVTLTATILLLRFADMLEFRNTARRLFGWSVIIGSNLSFGAVTVFSLKPLFVSEQGQQPLVEVTLLLTEFGIGVVLVALGAFVLWRVVELFRIGPGREKERTDPEEETRRVV
jgi:hypothetical protein